MPQDGYALQKIRHYWAGNSSYMDKTLYFCFLCLCYNCIEQRAGFYFLMILSFVISSGITLTTLITDIVPTIHTTAATLEIAVVVTGVSAFIIGALAGVLLYHCISKHRSAQLKLESSTHQQQQTEPEYEMPATSGKEEVKLRKNMAYDPVQRIELRGNVAYGPVQN